MSIEKNILKIDERIEEIGCYIFGLSNFINGLVCSGDRSIYIEYLEMMERVLDCVKEISYNIELVKEKINIDSGGLN